MSVKIRKSKLCDCFYTLLNPDFEIQIFIKLYIGSPIRLIFQSWLTFGRETKKTIYIESKQYRVLVVRRLKDVKL